VLFLPPHPTSKRYWVNDQHRAGRDGPVFLHLGGEGSLGPDSVMTGKRQEWGKTWLGSWQRPGRGNVYGNIGYPLHTPSPLHALHRASCSPGPCLGGSGDKPGTQILWSECACWGPWHGPTSILVQPPCVSQSKEDVWGYRIKECLCLGISASVSLSATV
jgi:hypothetical protein